MEPLTINLGGSTSAVATSGNVVTDSVTQHAVDVSLFGLADLQVAPTTASVALDRSTGTVTPSCNAGLVSYSTSGSLPTFVNVTQLTSLVNQILAQAGASSALGSALGSLLTGIIDYTPDGNLLTCDTSAPGSTASAKVGVLNLGLLSALQGGVGLQRRRRQRHRELDRRHAGRRHLARYGHAGRHAGRPGRRARRHHGAHRRVLGRDTADHSDGGHGPGRPAAHRPAPRRLARPLSQLFQPPPGWLSEPPVPIRIGLHGGPPPGQAFGTSSVPPPVSGAGPVAVTLVPGGTPDTDATTAGQCPPGHRDTGTQQIRRIGGGSRCSGNRCCTVGTGRRNPSRAVQPRRAQ